MGFLVALLSAQQNLRAIPAAESWELAVGSGCGGGTGRNCRVVRRVRPFRFANGATAERIRMRWKVASIDLSEPLTNLGADPGYDGVRAVFFWKGIPLGHARLAGAQLPLEPQHLAAIAAKAIAQAAGDYLLEEGFRSALPGVPEPPLENP